jgi:hypothetical protein
MDVLGFEALDTNRLKLFLEKIDKSQDELAYNVLIMSLFLLWLRIIF